MIYLTPALVIAKPLVKLGRRGRFTCRHRSHRLVMELPHGRVGLVEDKHVQPDRGGKREGPAVLPGFVYIRWNVLISPLSPFVRRQLFEPLMVEQKRFRRWGQPNASLLKIASRDSRGSEAWKPCRSLVLSNTRTVHAASSVRPQDAGSGWIPGWGAYSRYEGRVWRQKQPNVRPLL